jgi:hypothetical protein
LPTEILNFLLCEAKFRTKVLIYPSLLTAYPARERGRVQIDSGMVSIVATERTVLYAYPTIANVVA